LALALLVAAAAAAAAGTQAATLPFKATLKAPTADPKVNVRWWYTLRVTNLAGKPIAARITVEIVDPIGGVHPVEFSWSKTKTITNWPFKGTFRDGIKFPPESQGFPLTIRYTVKVKKDGKIYRKVLRRKVTPT
jgi:hypothetical protein